MKKVIALLLVLGTSGLVAFPNKGTLTTSQKNIYEIIRSHENRKYGDHGGHEYEKGEIDQKHENLPLDVKIKMPVYYDGLSFEDKTYRENVAAYSPNQVPVHQENAPHQFPASHSHYAIVDPITKNHQYVIFDAPNPKYEFPLAMHPKSSYIQEEEPHYVALDRKILTKPVVPNVFRYLPPVEDHLDKSHHISSTSHDRDNTVHGELGHKIHKKHEISGHKSYSTSAGHHGEHDHRHNRAHYERDRGYHYEKAYAYDRIRAHHDIESNKGAHSDHKAQHSHEGQKDSGSHGTHGYSYLKKRDKAGSQGYQDYGLQYLSPHQHAYGK